jgi:hypothetical protein
MTANQSESCCNSDLACADAGLISARVAALTEGVLKAMLLTKLKTVSGLVPALVVIAGMTGTLWQPLGAAQESLERLPVQAAEKPAGKERRLQAAEKPAGKERRQPTPRVLKTEGAVWRIAWSPKGLLVTASVKSEYAELEEDGKKKKVGFENTTVEVWQTAKEEAGAKPEGGKAVSLSVKAVLDAIDAKNRTISLTVPKRALKGKGIIRSDDLDIDVDGDGIAANKLTKLVNLPVAEDAMLMSGKKQIKLADLKAGMHVIVQLSSSERSQILVRRVELSKDDGFEDIEIEKKDKR